jgi:hypothetical protein
MNTEKWSLLIVMCVILFASCKKNNTSSSACDNTFTFLKNGSALTYSVDFLGDTSTSIVTYTSTSNASVFLQTISDVTDTQFNGQKVYLQGCNGWLTQSYTMNVNDTGYFIKEKRSVGDAWKYYDPTYQDINDYTVAQTNVSVKVPAGIFTCDQILYYQEGTFNTDTIWWNNSYGTIKYSGALLAQQLIAKNY